MKRIKRRSLLHKSISSLGAVALLFGAFSTTAIDSFAADKAAKSKTKKATTNKDKMEWLYDFQSGVKAAKKSKRMIFVDVGAEF